MFPEQDMEYNANTVCHLTVMAVTWFEVKVDDGWLDGVQVLQC